MTSNIEELIKQYKEIGFWYGWLEPHEEVKTSIVLQALKALSDFFETNTSLAKELRSRVERRE